MARRDVQLFFTSLIVGPPFGGILAMTAISVSQGAAPSSSGPSFLPVLMFSYALGVIPAGLGALAMAWLSRKIPSAVGRVAVAGVVGAAVAFFCLGQIGFLPSSYPNLPNLSAFDVRGVGIAITAIGAAAGLLSALLIEWFGAPIPLPSPRRRP